MSLPETQRSRVYTLSYRRVDYRDRGESGPTIGVVIDFPPVPAGDPLVVSASLFMTYAKCPDQALGRLRGFFPEESMASFRGGLAHRVFARHLADGLIPGDEFEQVCREEIGSSMNPKLGSLGLRPSQLRGVIKEVGDLYDRFKVLSSEGFRVSESFIEIDPTPDLTLRGSIDAIFDDPTGVRLVDWKTGGLYEVEEQLGFYAMLWTLDTGELPERVEAVSISSGERIGSVPTRESVVETAWATAELVGEIRAAFSAATPQLERLAGPWCRYCALLHECSEGAAAVRVSDAG